MVTESGSPVESTVAAGKMNFVHRFTRDEIERELHEAGFDLVLFETEGYGHAVGVSRADEPFTLPAAAYVGDGRAAPASS